MVFHKQNFKVTVIDLYNVKCTLITRQETFTNYDKFRLNSIKTVYGNILRRNMKSVDCECLK
jgi:hypothetical protein